MKYKKEIASILFLGLVCLLGVAVFISNVKIAARNPFNNKYKFIYPDKIAVDSKENIYIIDNGWKRITKLNKDGKVLFAIEGGVRAKDRFYFANDIAVDADDNFYVWNYSQKKDGDIEYQEIKKYSQQGKYEKTVIRLTDNKEAEAKDEVGLIKSGEELKIFYLQNNTIFFLSKDDKSDYAKLFKIENGKTVQVLAFKALEEIVDMKPSPNGKTYISEITGRLYEVDGTKIEPIEEAEFIKKPWALGVDKFGSLYFSDVLRGDIVKVAGDTAETFVSKDKIYQWIKNENIVIKNIGVAKSGKVYAVDESSNAIVVIKNDGNIEKIVREGKYPFSVFVFTLAVWGVLIAALWAFVSIFRIIYLFILKKKIPIVLKQLMIFIPVIVISIAFISIRIYSDFYKRYEESVKNQLFSMAQVGADAIDGTAIDNINSASDCGGSAHEYLKQQMRALITDDVWNNKLYSVIYKVKNNTYYIIGAQNDYYGTFFPYSYVQTAHKSAFEKGKIEYSKFSDSLGEWMIAVAPIRNKEGKIRGVYEVGMNSYIFKEANEKFIKYLILGTSLVAGVFILIFSLFSYLVLSPLQKLRDAVSRVSVGDYGARVDIKTRDEVGELCGGFNTMASHIKNYIEEINELNKVYFKFVPKEFINYIDKKNIRDIRLGDQVQKEMTIMFTDIRAFTTLSESMTPKENFDFINAYLRRVGPVIRKHGGFIDKYIGDAIMAIFPDSPENALRAIIEIKDKIDEYNIKRIKEGYKPISVGTGVHTGPLMFGIVGEEERVAGTVISDNVNLAARLEGLTKQYGAMAITTGETLVGVTAWEKYGIRFLGKVTVKGKSDVIDIYEILDIKNSETGKLKWKTKSNFENGVSLYFDRRIEEAYKLFNEVYAENRYDKAAALYIIRCRELIQNGIPENWDGVEKMTKK